MIIEAPNFDDVERAIRSGPTSSVFKIMRSGCGLLGVTMALHRHCSHIEDVSKMLQRHLNEGDIATALHQCRNTCNALSVLSTTLEQAYHWPERRPGETPSAIVRIKLLSHYALFPDLGSRIPHFNPDKAAEWALNAIEDGLCVISAALHRDHRFDQRIVNLLFRTSVQDVFLQQSSDQPNRTCMEFGALYEVVNTNGMMRNINEVFCREGGERIALELEDILSFEDPPPRRHLRRPDLITSACLQMQRVIQQVASVISATRYDEAVWGMTYLRFAKAVCPSTQDGTGADTASIHVIDAVIGYSSENPSEAMLIQTAIERVKYFPADVSAMIVRMHSHPPLRVFVDRNSATNSAFLALSQHYLELLEMHRKKALAIGVALRAGGLRCTAAHYSVSDPVFEANRALRASMAARFGVSEGSNVAVVPPLHATAHVAYPTLIGASFRTSDALEGAVIELTFDVPVLCEVCDRVNVSLPGGDARTFTVSRKQSTECLQIAVKNFSGGLSSILCEAFDPIKVLVTLKPAHHMRYTLNDSHQNTPVTFITQGTAACAPIEWVYDMILAKKTCFGSYKLLICCKSWRFVPLKEHIGKIAAAAQRLGHRLHFVFLFTKPEPADRDIVQRIQPSTLFIGRIDKFLQGEIATEISAGRGYVNGGAAFGVAVARCLWDAAPESADRCGPIRCPRIPQFRYDIYDYVPLPVALPSFSIRDVAMHNKPNDAWLAVDDYVYDITPIMGFHPGGQKVLVHVIGRRSGDVFDMIHGQSQEVKQILRACVVGRMVESDDPLAEAIDALVEMQNDATNSARFFDWPKPNSDVSGGPKSPPVFCMTEGLRAWSDNLACWLVRFDESGCDEVIDVLRKALFALDATTKRMLSAVNVASTSEFTSAHALVFEQRVQLWKALHEAFDASKVAVGTATSVVSCTAIVKTFVREAATIISHASSE